MICAGKSAHRIFPVGGVGAFADLAVVASVALLRCDCPHKPEEGGGP